MNDFNGKMKKAISDMLPKRELIRESVKRNAFVIQSSGSTGKYSSWKTILAVSMSLIFAAGLLVGGVLLRNLRKESPADGSGENIATDTVPRTPDNCLIDQTIYPIFSGNFLSGEESQYGVSVSELRNLVVSTSVSLDGISNGDIDEIIPWDTLCNVTSEEVYSMLECSLYWSKSGDENDLSKLYLLCGDKLSLLDFSNHPVSVISDIVPVSSQGNNDCSGFFVSGGWGSGVIGTYLYYFDMQTYTVSIVFFSSNSVYHLPDGSKYSEKTLTYFNGIRVDEYENGDTRYHLVSIENPSESICELTYMPDTRSFMLKTEASPTPELTTGDPTADLTDTDTDSGLVTDLPNETTSIDIDTNDSTVTTTIDRQPENTETEETPVTQPVDTEIPTVTDPVTTVDPYFPNLSGDYYGKEYRIVSLESYSSNMFGDDQKNAVSAAAERKYSQIENNFDVEIDVQLISDMNYITDSIHACDQSFEVIDAVIFDASLLITSGYVKNWNSLYGSNSLEIFGNKKINSALLLNGGLYSPVTDLSMSSLAHTYIWVYDKDLLGETNEKNLLQTFKSGEWTVDYAYSLVKDFYRDLNGNGTRDDEDAFGFVSNSGSEYDITGYLTGFGCTFINNNEYSPDLAKLCSARNSLVCLYGSPRAEYHPDFKSGIYYTFDKYDVLSKGASMMFTTVLGRLPSIREGDNFGILPYPKQTTEQKDYISGINSYYSVLLLPITADTSDYFIHDVTAALCSNETVVQTYFASILDGIGQKTEENIRMLELIRESRSINIAELVLGSNCINGIYSPFIQNMGKDDEESMLKGYTKWSHVCEETSKSFFEDLRI